MQEENLRRATKAMDQLLAAEKPVEGGPTRGAIAAAWAEVVTALDLQPLPQLRNCPHCHQPGVLGATRCGYCWVALTPPASLPA